MNQRTVLARTALVLIVVAVVLLLRQPASLSFSPLAILFGLTVGLGFPRVPVFSHLTPLLSRPRVLIGIMIVLGIWIDYVLVTNFNTLLWPYFWPRPAIYVLAAAFSIPLCLPQVFSGVWAIRLVGGVTIFIGQCYVLHSLDVVIHSFSLLALIHLIGVSGTFAVLVVSYINQITPRSQTQAPALPDELPTVAAVIPTYNEPEAILEETILSLKELDYPADRLHILVSDDGWREEIRALAERHGVLYTPGARKEAKAGNLNSALRYLEVHIPSATLILTQDADEAIDPSFLKKTVGYFSDPQLAFVQTPKDALAPSGDPFGVRDRFFYDSVQPGRNGVNAAFSCGSGVVWRIEAVKAIGGYATWNIVEDLTTSYLLHAAGYRSEYHNEVLTIGLAPDDIPGLLKQRGTWATDTWRLFLFRNPLTMPGLTVRQRLQYTELGLFYITASFFIPLVMLVPLLSLWSGKFVPIQGAALFPWLIACFLYYLVMARGNVEYFRLMWEYWIGHCPTYIKAFSIAIRSRTQKPTYVVTRKTRQDGFYGRMLWPQFLYLFVGSVAILHSLARLGSTPLPTLLVNIAIQSFFMLMCSRICRAAFYGVKFRFPNLPFGLAAREAEQASAKMQLP